MSLRNFESRIARLERLLDEDGGGELQSVPLAWLESDPITGEHIGPPEGAFVSPGQQQMLDALAAMNASVPAMPPVNEGADV